jgi:hypothetical protein
VLAEPRPDSGFTAKSRTELRVVLRTHTSEKIEIGYSERADTCECRDGATTIAENICRCERVRATTRPPSRHEPRHVERVEHLAHVFRNVSNRAAGQTRRGCVARTRERDEPQPVLAGDAVPRPPQRRIRWRAVVQHECGSERSAAHEKVGHPTVVMGKRAHLDHRARLRVRRAIRCWIGYLTTIVPIMPSSV